jgi:hypothetical protein
LPKSTRDLFSFIDPQNSPANSASSQRAFFSFNLQFFSDSILLGLDNGEHFHFPNTDEGFLNALKTAAWAEEEGRAVA